MTIHFKIKTESESSYKVKEGAKMFLTILCTIIDFVISKLSPFIILFILFKWYKKNDGLIISAQDRVNFINQYKDSSDEGMRAWAELYESDERTRKLSRIVFSILFIPVIFFAILVVYFSIKKYMG